MSKIAIIFQAGPLSSLVAPDMRELQRRVLRDALTLLTENTRPGEYVTREYPEYGEYHEPPRVKAGAGS